jgi:hypothetical protein
MQWRFSFRSSFTRSGSLGGIDAGLPNSNESAAVVEAIRRDKELSSGRVTGRTHEKVMEKARRALECD